MDEVDADVVQVHVPLGHLDGFFIQVDAGDFGGAGEFGGDGETAGVAAEVEDLEALGEGAEAATVVALVAEEAGLVAFREVDLLDHAELLDLHEADGRFRDIGRHDTFNASDMRVDLDDLALGADGVVQDGDPAGEAAHDRIRRDFDGKHVAEAVDDQARKEVGVGIDHAIGIRVFVELQDVLTEGGRAADGLFEPDVIGLARRGLENAEGDGGTGVPETVTDERALLVIGGDDVALASIRRDFADHRAEDRRLGRERLQLHPRFLARDGRGDVGQAVGRLGHADRFGEASPLASPGRSYRSD